MCCDKSITPAVKAVMDLSFIFTNVLEILEHFA